MSERDAQGSVAATQDDLDHFSAVPVAPGELGVVLVLNERGHAEPPVLSDRAELRCESFEDLEGL